MKVLIILTVSLALWSCKKHKVQTGENGPAGKWELKQVVIPFTVDGEKTIDVSADHTSYDFQRSGALVVSGYRGYGIGNGTHNYIYKKDYLMGQPEPGAEMIDLVIIENTRWVYTYSSGRMSLSTTYFDGPLLHFERPGKSANP